jgi:hypothetical protein
LLLDAMDWAIKQNGESSSPFYNRLDTTKIAVMGQSCGGLQALAVSHDPRVMTTVVWNSGALPAGSTSPALKQSAGNKDSLNLLHGPVAYFIGGPSDVASPMPRTTPRVSGKCRSSRGISTSVTAERIGNRAEAGSVKLPSRGWTINSRAAPTPRSGSSARIAGCAKNLSGPSKRKG